MENRSNATIAGGGADHNSVVQFREEWRLAREAHKDLQSMGMPRTNLLLVGSGGATRIVLEMLWLELREPIVTWRPGQGTDLPASDRVRTLILHDASDLSRGEQQQLLRWLDRATGRIRIVSTSEAPLWPLVRRGAFDSTLYYRLNTVCVDAAV